MPQNIVCEFTPPTDNSDLDKIEEIARQISITSPDTDDPGVIWKESEKGVTKKGKPYLRIKAILDEFVVSIPEFFEALCEDVSYTLDSFETDIKLLFPADGDAGKTEIFPDGFDRHSQESEADHILGDSLVKANSQYPLEGSLKTLGQLFKVVNNPKATKFWLETYGIKYIVYYNPYNLDPKALTFGLFDYFKSLEEFDKFLREERPAQTVHQYFQRERAFFSFHVYELHCNEGDFLKSELKILGPEDCPKEFDPKHQPKEPTCHEFKTSKPTPEAVDLKIPPAPSEVPTNPQEEVKKPSIDTVTLLSLADIQSYATNPKELEEKYPPKFVENLTTKSSDEIDPLQDSLLEYDGPKIAVHDVSKPFKYVEIITNFLHKWIDEPEEKLAKVKEFIRGEANLDVFIKSLRNMYVFYYQLAKAAYETSQEEIDKVGKETNNPWYNLFLEYLETYVADKDFNTKVTYPDKIEDGSLIDIEGYRGTGLFYVCLDPEVKQRFIKNPASGFIPMSAFKVLPTLGDFGHILPEPGFNLVKKHGLAFFLDSEISGFQISHLRKVKIKLDNGDYQQMRYEKPMYLETSLEMELDTEEMDEVIVDGVYLYGFLTTNFV